VPPVELVQFVYEVLLEPEEGLRDDAPYRWVRPVCRLKVGSKIN
jgi:hypothetical protein